MKIVIVGPGAMGLLLYGLLSKARQDVWVLDKSPERAGRLKKDGIRIEGVMNSRFQDVRFSAEPAEYRDADFWFVCVKSYDTKNVIKRIASHVSERASVVSFQNGVGNIELLTEAFGAGRVLLAVSSQGATLLGEGRVHYAGEGEIILGRVDGALTAQLKSLREFFQKARVPVKLSRDVQAVLWSKLIINAGINAVAAVTGLKNGRIMKIEGARRLAEQAITEAHRVAKRKRIKLLYDDVLAKAESVCEATSENISSMLADVLRKKPTEIDAINGAILRHAQSLGLKTPVNAFLVDVVKTLESNYSA
ncbi:MAG: 2-dehydropantoate 2-reductase [Candidatus Omnitrophota bacterium]